MAIFSRITQILGKLLRISNNDFAKVILVTKIGSDETFGPALLQKKKMYTYIKITLW